MALQDKSAARERLLETEAQQYILNVQLLEEKNAAQLEQFATLTKQLEDREKEVHSRKATI